MKCYYANQGKNYRIVSFINDCELIRQHLILGWSKKLKINMELRKRILQLRILYFRLPNGLGNILSSYGFLYLIVYLYLFCLSIFI